MKELTAWAICVVTLLFASQAVGGESQGQGGGRKENAEKAVKSQQAEPNVREGPIERGGQVERKVTAVRPREPNSPPQAPQQGRQVEQQAGQPDREKLREQARERIRQRAVERRGGPAADMNAVAAKAKTEQQAKGKEGVVDKAAAEGKQHEQQMGAIEEQIAHEQAKHGDRLARLKRIRELAEQKGDADTVARVDKLLDKEQQRYDAKTQRMGHRKDRVSELSEKAEPDKGAKRGAKEAVGEGGQPKAEKK